MSRKLNPLTSRSCSTSTFSSALLPVSSSKSCRAISYLEKPAQESGRALTPVELRDNELPAFFVIGAIEFFSFRAPERFDIFER